MLAEALEAWVPSGRLEQRIASEVEDPRVMQGAGLLQPLEAPIGIPEEAISLGNLKLRA